MKFPSLFTTLKLLKPFSKTKSVNNNDPSSYDKIEDIIVFAQIHINNLEVVVKFYKLSQIQQQLTIVTLIEHKMLNALEMILLSSFDINFLIRGQTPLHFAIKDQNLNIVKLLLQHNADLELTDNFKETALNSAVRVGNIEIINYLLEQGAEVNTKASDSRTPLDFAVHQRNLESINILGKYGALLGGSCGLKKS